MNKVNTFEEKREELLEIIDDNDKVMMTSISLNGNLVSRPMVKQDFEFDGDLWFLTKTGTAKYDEIKANPKVNVAFTGKSFASIAGKAYIVQDDLKKKELWNKVYEEMFDTSYDDPDLVLIKVEAESAEYWATGNVFQSIVSFVKEVTGQDGSDEDINDSIDLA